MIRKLCLAAATVLLASCSTAFDGQIQDVTIETEGASNTLCYMQNPDFSFRFYPPQTLKVTKSPDPYTIRCLAPGNREKTIVVEPKMAESAKYNMANLGVGLALDRMSNAMYELPDKIVISFEGMQPTGYPEPAYNRFFDKNPQLKGMEEFRPGQSALQRDAGKETPSLKLRDTGDDDSSSVVFGGRDPLDAVDVPADRSVSRQPAVAPPVPAASNSMSADTLTRSMNPKIFGGSSTPAASGEPVPMGAQ